MDPILILQMQRMGDLVLSFPLEGWLKSRFPQTPIWVVGEPLFYNGLIPFSPPVTYFAYADAQTLRDQNYSLVINLSHRREAAALSSALLTDRRLGPYLDSLGNMRIDGPWQLYRASINNNNRHNLFHWADLNAMDIIGLKAIQRTVWPKAQAPTGGRVGLFVGANETEKRPDPAFWAALVSRLMRMGAKPVLLGGKKDQNLADETARLCASPAINLCGRFSIPQLCRLLERLDLLITPDTGPMHIAAWLGTPVLNLSLGPVNAWETGPFPPGHHVLRPALSCAGCWTCGSGKLTCKAGLKAEQVAVVARLLLERTEIAAVPELRDWRLFTTRRDLLGLFQLESLVRDEPYRLSRSLYWKYFFGLGLRFLPESARDRLPELAQAMCCRTLGPPARKAGQKLLMRLNLAIRGQGWNALRETDAWLDFPPFFRPLSSYVQFLLHNENFSHAALAQALELAEAYLADMKAISA